MKKITYTLLMAALVCGLSLGITSCKDDDKDDSGDDGQEQLSEEQQEQNNAAYAILDNLADLSSANDNFLTQTFEPTIGTADDGDAGTRIVNTNDMETAAMRFADLVGVDINENTASYTWTDDELGTMTYTKTNDGKSWATVDVNIKQVPHLQKIIYRSPEQADNNGKFEGTAYYRFGDVVKKVNAAGAEEYWICVRPAFGPEGKDKSHWVTIDALPKENVWTYTGSNGINYALPTGLGNNHEHSQNFAEMLFAICFPEEWENNIVNNLKKIPMFHDFDKDNLKYHRKFFWERVQKAWTAPDAATNVLNNQTGISVFNSIFGEDGDLNYFQTMLKSADGLNLLTNGFSWWTKSSNKPTLYRYRFVNGADKESNMHKEPLKKDVLKNYSSVSAEVIKSKIKLNCNTDYNITTPGWTVPEFFGTANKHYIIRHATGADLAEDKKEDPKEPLKGVTEIYRYNKYYKITDLSVEPETFEGNVNPGDETKEVAYKNRAYYMVGDVVRDENGILWFCVQPSGHGDPDLFGKYPYSYFVSFDKRAVGERLQNIPRSKQLAAQMLFSMEMFFHNYMDYANAPIKDNYKQEQNIREKAGVKLSELIAIRDTLHTSKKVKCTFANALYINGGGPHVLRLVGDNTVEYNGVRDWLWLFYDKYTSSLLYEMPLSDLGDPNNINFLNKDQWVSLPWYDIYAKKEVTTNIGPRTNTEDVDNLKRFIYVPGRSYMDGTAPANMYREPIMAFAVRRVKDEGKKSTAFSDTGDKFYEYAMMKDVDNSFLEDELIQTSLQTNVYNSYKSHSIYLDDKNWPFGMDNAVVWAQNNDDDEEEEE